MPEPIERLRVLQITDETVERAAKEMHAVSGHTFPSGKLTRWPDDLTDFQREQFRVQARRVLAVAFL